MLLLVARRAKTALMQRIDARLKVPYLPVYCALFCPYLHKDKATKRATAFGLFGECCFISTFKLLRFLFRFLAKLQVITTGQLANLSRF